MRGYLLDTVVVSETMKPVPNARVSHFLDTNTPLWMSVVVEHELAYGVARLPDGRRRRQLDRGYRQLVSQYAGRTLPLDRDAAARAASFRALAERDGWELDISDSFIAGTAATHDLALATRNVRHFERLPINVLDPWEY